MLDMGFREELEGILDATPPDAPHAHGLGHLPRRASSAWRQALPAASPCRSRARAWATPTRTSSTRVTWCTRPIATPRWSTCCSWLTASARWSSSSCAPTPRRWPSAWRPTASRRCPSAVSSRRASAIGPWRPSVPAAPRPGVYRPRDGDVLQTVAVDDVIAQRIGQSHGEGREHEQQWQREPSHGAPRRGGPFRRVRRRPGPRGSAGRPPGPSPAARPRTPGRGARRAPRRSSPVAPPR